MRRIIILIFLLLTPKMSSADVVFGSMKTGNMTITTSSSLLYLLNPDGNILSDQDGNFLLAGDGQP